MMGQAKLRGTFEERKAQAVERNTIAEKERAKADIKYKENNVLVIGRRNRLRSSMLVAIAAAMSPMDTVVVNGYRMKDKRR